MLKVVNISSRSKHYGNPSTKVLCTASYRPHSVTWFALRKGNWVRKSVIWSH